MRPKDNRAKTILTALSSLSSIGLSVQYLVSTYGAAAMAYIPPEVWTVGYMLGASGLAIGAAGFAATQSQRWIVRADLKRARGAKPIAGLQPGQCCERRQDGLCRVQVAHFCVTAKRLPDGMSGPLQTSL